MSSNPEQSEGHILRDPRAIALLMTASLVVMAAAAISPVLPSLQERFADHPNVQLIVRMLVPAPALSVVLFAPLAGWIGDKFGRRQPMLLGLIIFSLAGGAGMILPDLTWILISRFILGVGLALIMTSETALVGDYFVGQRRATFAGWQITATNFGGFIFIALASWWAGYSSTLPFAVYLLTALYIPYVLYAIPRTSDPQSNVATSSTPAQDVSSEQGLWKLSVFGVGFLALTSMMCFFVVPTQFPFFVAERGYSASTYTGFALGALTLVGGCAALFQGRLQKALAISGTMAVGFVAMTIGFFLLATGDGMAPLILAAALIGAGWSTLRPGLVVLTLKFAPARKRGFAVGILTTGMFLGQFLSPLAIGPLVDAYGFAKVFLGLAAVLSLATIVASLIRLGSAAPSGEASKS